MQSGQSSGVIGVADGDLAVREDLGVQPGAMGERPHQAQVADHLLQVVARLAQLDPAALDLADLEAPADERVQAHAARRELPARLAGRERDPVLGREPLELLALDERQLAGGLGARLEVAVAAQARAATASTRSTGWTGPDSTSARWMATTAAGSDMGRGYRRCADSATLLRPALLAQLVEHFHGKEGVIGSSPMEGSPASAAARHGQAVRRPWR